MLAGGLVWETSARALDVSFFPPVSAVLARLAEMVIAGEVLGLLASSLTNLLIGFTISLVAGIAIGLAMGLWPLVDAALGPYVKGMLTAPGLVFAPVFFSVFGLGRATIVGVIVIYATFVIIINTAAAVQSAPIELLEMTRAFCAGRWYTVKRVVLPAAIPLIMAGVKLGAGRAVKGMINGEMFIAVVGLGSTIIAAGRNFDAVTVLAVLALIILVAFGVLAVVEWIDRRLTPWLPKNVRA